MEPVPQKPVVGGLIAVGLGAVFFFVFVWGLAHLQGEARVVRTWHAGGRPKSLETRTTTGRAGLCLAWDANGVLDAAASGVFGEFTRERGLSEEELARYGSSHAQIALDLQALRAAVVAARAEGERAPRSLQLLLRESRELEGAHVVPCDPWGRAYEYAAEDRAHPARVWTLGRDAQVGGSGEDADCALEWSGSGEPCEWSGSLAAVTR